MSLYTSLFVATFFPFGIGLIPSGNPAVPIPWSVQPHSVSEIEYVQPFLDLTDDLQCRDERCTPQDCGYTSKISYDNSIEQQVNCSCQISCYSTGRCCLNYEEVCLSGHNRTQWLADTFPHESALIQLSNLQKTSMTDAEYYETLTRLRSQLIVVDELRQGTKRFPVVSKCPACGSENSCHVIKKRCEKTRVEDFEQFVPVLINRQLYANKYCAQCTHGVDLRNMTYVTNSLEIGCSTDKALEVEESDKLGVLQLIKSGLCEAYPSEILFSEDGINPVTKFPIINKCDIRYKHILANYSAIDEACKTYSASLALKQGIEMYGFQNSHCALCNFIFPPDEEYDLKCICTENDEALDGCMPPSALRTAELLFTPTPFFHVALDFRGKIEVEKGVYDKCNEHQYLDVLTKHCIRRSCARDLFKYENRCLALERLQIVQSSDYNSDYGTSVCMIVDKPVTSTERDALLHAYEDELRTKRVVSGVHILNHSGMRCKDISSSDFPDSTQILYQHPKNSEHNIRITHFLIAEYLSLMATMTKNQPVIGLVVQFGPQSRSTCPKGFLQKVYSDVTITWTGYGRLVKSYLYSELKERGSLYFPDLSLSVNLTEISLVIKISKDRGVWKVDVSALICISVNDSCPVEAATSGDCSLPVEPLFLHRSLHLPWDSIFTVVSACLSCLALLFTLAIHITLPTIMKSGGRIFVQLIISLLLAEVGILSSALMSNDGLECVGLAAFQHFAWLSAFMWTALLSWDIFSTFVIDKVQSPAMRSTSLSLPYLLIGWLLPALLVICCIVLHSVGLFPYGGQSSCWISSPFHLAFSFGLPVAAVILFNAILYSIVVKNIQTRMAAAAVTGQDYDLKTRFILYCKMSTIVGFTWIFGFLANIEYLGFMAYIFSFSASLDGIFIGAAFTLSPTAVREIRRKWESMITKSSNPLSPRAVINGRPTPVMA